MLLRLQEYQLMLQCAPEATVAYIYPINNYGPVNLLLISNAYNLISTCSPHVQVMTSNSASHYLTLNYNLDNLFRK